MADSQSPLSGGMLADGFAGGRIPVAAAGPLESPAPMKLMTKCADWQQKCRDPTTGMDMHVVFPLLTPLVDRSVWGRNGTN